MNYVHETLSALDALGVRAELLVPGPAPENWRPDEVASPPYKVTWVDSDYPSTGEPTRKQRYAFCREVNRHVVARLRASDRPEILHVLFGLFMMEELDTQRLSKAGLVCVATVHNVPPMECGQVAHNAPLPARLKEKLRLHAVAFKNKARLKKQSYDLYIVPSEQVRGLLIPVVGDDIEVVAHGPTSDLQALMKPPSTRRPNGTLRLLTVGGYVPHKRQHIIPAAAEALRDAGMDFIWDVVGPSGRVPCYHDGIQAEATKLGLTDRLRLHHALPFTVLAELYDQAHIYVQPSVEEGFCLTALDAAAAGLPVVGSRAGALPEIIAASGGLLLESESNEIARAIMQFVEQDLWQDTSVRSANVLRTFSWNRAAKTLKAKYELLAKEADSLAREKM